MGAISQTSFIGVNSPAHIIKYSRDHTKSLHKNSVFGFPTLDDLFEKAQSLVIFSNKYSVVWLHD